MKYQVQIKYTNPAHEHVSLRRRVDTVTRLVEAKSEQEALNRAANQQRALGFMIKEASVVKPEVIKEEAEQVDELKASTLGSYISKASKDEVARREQGKVIQAKFKEAGLGNVGIPYDRKLHSKTASRAAGKTLAIKKLTGMAKVTANEEAEQIDERSHLNKQLKNRVMRQIGSHAFIEKGTDEGSPLKTGRKVAKTTPSEKVAKMYRTLPNPVKTAEEVEQVTEAEREAGYKMSPAVKAAQAKSDALSKVKKPAQAGTLAAKKQNMEEEKANVNASKVKLRTLKDKISNRLKTVNMNPTIDSGKL